MTQPTLRIGLPVYESVTAHTLGALLSIAEYGPWEIVRGTWIDKARNQLMANFEEDLLLMLDSDMVFTPEDVRKLLQRLISHPECGAVSGDYIMRDGSCMPACDWRHPQNKKNWIGNEDRQKLAERHRRNKELVYVDSLGAGFLAITQEAKQKLGPPWFKTVENDLGEFVGEDTFFCERLQQEGFKPAVDFGLPVGHVGHTVFWPGDEPRKRP